MTLQTWFLVGFLIAGAFFLISYYWPVKIKDLPVEHADTESEDEEETGSLFDLTNLRREKPIETQNWHKDPRLPK